MPRQYGKKGIKEEDDFLVEPKQNQIKTSDLTSENFIKRLQQDYPYWFRKGSKLTCSLCRFNVQFSCFSALKTEISTHMKSKRHKKKVDSHNAEKGRMEKPEIDDKSNQQKTTKETNYEKNEQEKNNEEVKMDVLLHIVKEVKYHQSSGMGLTENNQRKCKSNNCLTDFETTYCLLEKANPTTQSSKKFILKAKDGTNYFCTVCQELIFDSLNTNEFRYNLWMHINDEKHREKLPNFSKVERDFQKLMCRLSKKIPANLKDDLKYFQIGPVFRYVKCSLCNSAVSENLHRLENHIQGKYHQKNKENGPTVNTEQSNQRHTCNWFRRLISDMETQFKEAQFKEDIKYIHVGKMPGYVICSLCSHIILPTFYFMKVHFVSDEHIKNKTANLIAWESSFKTDVKERLQVNPKDYSMFEVSKYGLTCHKCNVTVPATSYMLYCHISKSGCVSTQ